MGFSATKFVRFPALSVALLSATALACTACWYDSRWGQAKAAQKQYAAQVTPSTITATDDERRGTPRRTYHIRLRPDAHYLSQTVEADRQLEALVEDANGIVGPELGLHLEVERTEPWSLDSDENLEAALAGLGHDDAGDDVDVVVGLIGALPRPTDSFHEVGCANVLGKHLVLRAASRLGEYDAVDRAFTELGADERERLVRARRRHRAEAVFLHELGHVLGGLHETDVTSLMHPVYGQKMASYSDDGVALMRLALDAGDRASVGRAQLEYLRSTKTSAWAPSERDAAIERLEAMTAPPRLQATGSPPPAPTASAAPSGEAAIVVPFDLKGPDRERFTKAASLFQAGAVQPAYEAAKSLFSAYPNTFAVQELRCQLATVRWLDKSAMLAECAPSVRLADAGADGPH
jgi:Matrixin